MEQTLYEKVLAKIGELAENIKVNQNKFNNEDDLDAKLMYRNWIREDNTKMAMLIELID